MLISKKISEISSSLTLAITDKAKKMQAEGINIIGFGAGEPDFDTPLNIKEAAKKAINDGFTKYTSTSGIKELKDAICNKFKIDNNLEYSPDEILVSCGAKHSIFNAVLALCDEGDEVILPSPYWVSYPEIIKVPGAKAIVIKTLPEKNFKIDSHLLKEAITIKTKLVILNSPSNPTGMVYNRDELERLGKMIVQAGIYCISDEVYEKIIYDGQKHISIASLGDELKKLTIVVNGFSKAYSMPGWRIGYAAGPKEIIQAMSNLQDHSTSNSSSISQIAAVEALEGDQSKLERMVEEFKKRRDYMVERINSIQGLSTIKPQGAFYCWVDVSGILRKSFNGRKLNSSLKLTELFLVEANVALIPGCVFGDDNYIRLSYATSMENIVEGVNRIDGFINRLT